MAEASPIDEATRWQASLSYEQKLIFARDLSELDLIEELAPSQSSLASLERAAAEAVRNASTARS